MPRFVVQEHDAKKAGLHYDFRLEEVMTKGHFDSWVVPRLAFPQAVRLAIPVEPHTEACSYFVGTYGPGYGEGTVEIWDRGTYTVIEKTDGMIKFSLEGKRLNGIFELKLKPDGNWLLIEKDSKYSANNLFKELKAIAAAKTKQAEPKIEKSKTATATRVKKTTPKK